MGKINNFLIKIFLKIVTKDIEENMWNVAWIQKKTSRKNMKYYE